MAHVETAHLLELALGNAPRSDDDVSALRHIAVCVRCRDELRLMVRVVAAARTTDMADLPATPPERVWRRIAQELSQETDTLPPPAADTAHRPTAGTRDRPRLTPTDDDATPVRCLLFGLLSLLAGIAVVRWSRHARSPTTA
ncbi:hypothetical protein [Streptomyces cavernae]|uniref:hypothetical protein n=1 Tax=Streptomyces cavernae TaxID=2259034 RepID=UPI000FEBBC0B|nr:hypothetical protein [Streptomyces cavernae]